MGTGHIGQLVPRHVVQVHKVDLGRVREWSVQVTQHQTNETAIPTHVVLPMGTGHNGQLVPRPVVRAHKVDLGPVREWTAQLTKHQKNETAILIHVQLMFFGVTGRHCLTAV